MKKPNRKKSTAKNAAWKWCSEYIRRKNADHEGIVKCTTCQKSLPWREMHAGHFINKSRGASIYFVEENIHPQCPRCNLWLEGNKHIYTLYMIDTYGRERIEELEQLARKTESWRLADYEEMEDYYKGKCGEL